MRNLEKARRVWAVLGTTIVSLSEQLEQAQGKRCLTAIAERYRLPQEQVWHATNLLRPVVLRQIDVGMATPVGAKSLLRTLAQPSLAEIEAKPAVICDHPVRLAGDAIHRQLSRHDTDMWATLDSMARTVGISHQTFRAMVPLLTLVILSAIRRATAPAFLRLLQQHRPGDAGTDPFAFAMQHAEWLEQRNAPPQRPQPPETALRWLDGVLARAQDDTTNMRMPPAERF